MNENEVNNNNQNNVVTPVEPVVSGTTPIVDNANVAGTTVSPVMSTPVEAVSNEQPYMAPHVDVFTVSANSANLETTKKKSKTGLIVIIVLLVVIALAVGGYVLYNGKEEKTSTGGTENNNTEVNKPAETPNNNEEVKGNLIEDVIISGHFCYGTDCTISLRLKDSKDYVNYEYNGQHLEFLTSLNHYEDYIKVNIYVTGEGENIEIVNYELFNKSTNAKIEGIATEAELRTVLGMYNFGTYTAEFTLVDIGNIGAGFNNDKSYTYRDYGFVDEKGIEYEMRYINPGSNLDALVEGNKYTVTFEVTEGTFKYEFTIKEIK